MQVRDLLSGDVITLQRTDDLETLMRVVAESSQDVFPVLDERRKVVGTVSELDLLRVIGPSRRVFPFGPRKLIREGLVRDVEDVMTPRPATTRPNESLQVALNRMESLQLPQLVVVDEDGKLVGLLRARDLFRALFGREK